MGRSLPNREPGGRGAREREAETAISQAAWRSHLSVPQRGEVDREVRPIRNHQRFRAVGFRRQRVALFRDVNAIRIIASSLAAVPRFHEVCQRRSPLNNLSAVRQSHERVEVSGTSGFAAGGSSCAAPVRGRWKTRSPRRRVGKGPTSSIDSNRVREAARALRRATTLPRQSRDPRSRSTTRTTSAIARTPCTLTM